MKGSYSDFNCDLCKKEGRIFEETQKHILNCEVLKSENNSEDNTEYEEIFSNNIYSQLKISKIIMEHMEIKSKFEGK